MHDKDLRKLWQQQQTPQLALNVAALRAKAISFRRGKGFDDSLRFLGVGFIVVFLPIILFRRYGWELHGILAKLGALAMAAGAAYVLFQLRKYWTRAVPPESAAASLLAFHLQELTRRRDLLMNFWRLIVAPLVPGVLLLMTDVFLRPGNPIPMLLPSATILALAVLTSWMNRRRGQQLQREIDALVALQ